MHIHVCSPGERDASTGIFRPVRFIEQTEEHLEEALGSILRPTFWVSQAVLGPMRERGGGAIVNVGSMWAVDAIATTPRALTRWRRPAATP